MLANHYYLVKNHHYAGALFQEVIVNEPKNYEVKKKLMVCLLKEGIFYPAWNLYTEIIENEPLVILETIGRIHDCLCVDVLKEIQKIANFHSTNWINLIELGILYSFNDAKKSVYCFKRASKLSPFKNEIENLISHIELVIYREPKPSSPQRKEFL